jgi:hypothetical protein
MARSDGPPNGSDHPPQNGHRAKQVAIALFIATTFGTMAILSFPVFRAGGPLQPGGPVAGGNTPSERPLRPILPSIAPPSGPRPSGGGVALGPPNAGTIVNRIPVGPSGPGGGPGPGGPPPGQPPPGQPPPGGNPPPGPPTTVVSTVPLRTTLLNLATMLSHRTTNLSPPEVRTVRAIIAIPKDLRKACMADRECAKALRMVRKLLHKLEPHGQGKGHRPHGHRGHHGKKDAKGAPESDGVLPDREHRRGHHGHGNGSDGKHKHKKHGTTQGKHKHTS